MIRRLLAPHVSPRSAAILYFLAIVATGLVTGLVIALVLLRFLSGSLLAAMGDACGGIFEYGHGFLAASRVNYLLALVVGAIFFSQICFLLGGGTKLLRASHRLKKQRGSDGLSCPALAALCGAKWGSFTFYLPGDQRIDAHTVGLLRPRIVLTEGLVDTLDWRQLMAVMAHEEAHRSRRDNLTVAIAKAVALTLFYLPGPRMALRELQVSLEKSADRLAAARSGGTLVVAEALASIATAASAERSPAVVMTASGNSSGGQLTDRLADLLDDSRSSRGRTVRILLFVSAMAATLLVFTGSALAVVGTDQKDALICFTEHQQVSGPEETCAPDHPE